MLPAMRKMTRLRLDASLPSPKHRHEIATIGRKGHGGQVTNDPACHLAGAPIRITRVKKGSFVNRQTNLRTNDLDLVKHSHTVL